MGRLGQVTGRIRLFGGLALSRHGRWETVESGRVESLLAYLALHRESPVPRQQLSFLLWPDTTEAQSRTNLRGVLHTMRRAMPDVDEVLEITPQTLQWRPDGWQLDVAEFDAALSDAGAGEGVEGLRRAVALYRGDLAPGSYDDWLLEIRADYRERFRDALRRLAFWHEQHGEVAEAVEAAERLLRSEPLDEAAARTMLRLYDALGDRARALRVYHGTVAALDRELGVAPSAETQAAYDVLLAGDTDVGTTARDAPFVGRAEQRAALVAAWREAASGRAGLVLVTGEAGIGKTRLVEELSAWCARQGAATVHAGSYAAEDRPAYAPFMAWLRAGPVRRATARLDPERAAALSALVPELHGQVQGGAADAPVLPDDDRRLRLWDAVSEALLAVGAPLLLVADDVQWADPATLQLLHYVLRTAPEARLLVVATARDDELDVEGPLRDLVHSMRRLDRLSEIGLDRLSAADTATLAARLVGHPLPAPDVARLCRETEGNPLFVVEAVRAGLPLGTAVTPRVQAVIEARLAVLSGHARDLAGVAAAIGREFDVDVLTHASGFAEGDLVAGLDELWRRRVVRERGAAAYDFSHDQIRAVAYAALGPATRRRHHLRIARALERTSRGPQPDAARVAAHYRQAGQADDAARWYARAAHSAQRVYAAEDAVRHLDRAVEALHSLPATAERDRRELTLLGALPAALASVEGYASPRVSTTHARCLELAHRLGAPPDPPLLWSLAFASLVGEDFPAAERFAAELRDRGLHDGDQVLVVEGTCLLGIGAFWRADLVTARVHLDDVVRRYRRELRDDHLMRFGQDPEVVALARLANTWCLLGDRDRAVEYRDRARARADEGRHPLTRGAALVFAGVLALDLDDPDAARAVQADLQELRTQATPIHYLAEAMAGYVAVLDGDPEAGIAGIRAVLLEARARPAAPGMTALLGRVLLAACAAAGDRTATRDAARRLLDAGGAARVWAAAAQAHLEGPIPG
jgi:DNA-binding SARP family transcriptional activator